MKPSTPCEHCGATRRHRLGCPMAGKIARAVQAVHDGASVVEACAVEQCTTSSVYAALKHARTHPGHPLAAPASKSELAAQWLSEHGGTAAAAAEAHGVTTQSVCQTWGKLFPGSPLPLAQARSARDDKIAELATGGVSRAQIAEALAVSPEVVTRVLHGRGIALRGQGMTARGDVDDAFGAAVTAVIGGVHPIDAAAETGVSYAGLRNRLAAMGIEAAADATPRGNTGRIARAVELARQGKPVPEACAAERCAPSSVYAALRQAAKS